MFVTAGTKRSPPLPTSTTAVAARPAIEQLSAAIPIPAKIIPINFVFMRFSFSAFVPQRDYR
jgi:hypothetical protein